MKKPNLTVFPEIFSILWEPYQGYLKNFDFEGLIAITAAPDCAKYI
jgi:hypothetical protein